jgi:hypothetical protein
MSLGKRSVLRGVLAAGLAVVGCKAPGPDLKTPVPEKFELPSEDDPRYSKPLEYPKELLNKGPTKPTNPNGPPGFKGGPSMGGGGPGGPGGP